MENGVQPIARSSRRQSSRISKRSKTFSGCSTCRSRHLKCDEERPKCRRCSKAGLQCSGYPGYRAEVLWKPVKSLPSQNEDQPSQVANNLPNASSPASAAASRNDYAQSLPRSIPSNEYIDNAIPAHLTDTGLSLHKPRQKSGIHAHSARQLDAADVVDPEQNFDSSTELQVQEVQQPEESGADIGFFERRVQGFPLASDHADIAFPLQRTQPITKTHLDDLPHLQLQIQLVDHWMTFLGDALMPTPASYNPNKDIFVPIALNGASSPVTATSGAVALFYLLCAASAFHLSVNSTDNRKASDFMSLALYHHSRGVSHLQRNLAGEESSQHEAILASLLLCITYEPVTVETSFWRTHLSGASSWLRKTNVSTLTQSEPATILYQCLAVTAIFLRSQLTFDKISLDENFPFDVNTISDEPNYLLEVFGLAASTLKGISQTISLVAKARHHCCSEDSNCSGSSCSLHSEQQLNRMEIELYLAVPKDPAGTALHSETNITYHYTRIFYFASLIYFKRILRSYPLNSVELLVEQAFRHIEALEACTSCAFSPFVWPIGVAFLEARGSELQKRALAWLDFISERSKLSIWPKLKVMLCNFWAKRDAGGAEEADNLKWDEYLNDPDVPDIMMV